MKQAIITPASAYKEIPFEWGSLTWYVSKALGSSETLTVGRCVLKPGQANPRHYHPNCDEVLHVLQGRILHTMHDQEAPMSEGDTISIPLGVPHNARNIGETDAILLICFSSAERETIGEDESLL
jgi:quercetin dioxygenase-like cupin family protein